MNEFELIEKLTKNAQNRAAEGLIRGVGDDCAVIAGTGNRDWLLSTDAFYEHIHFQKELASYKDIGRKALAVNVSDIAAMGGRPRFYFVAVGIPDGVTSENVQEMFKGMEEYADLHNIVLVGGDTCATDRNLTLSLTLIGDVPHGRAVYRRGARVGDGVYVTGYLGASKLGLYALQNGLTGGAEQDCIEKHLKPTPRLESANWLASTGCVSSMIDVSDGLIQDLGHITRANKVGMHLDAILIPIFEKVSEFAPKYKMNPLEVALSSGEEYELAFTVSGVREPAFTKLLTAGLRTLPVHITRIGRVVEGDGIRVLDPNHREMPIKGEGFKHSFG